MLLKRCKYYSDMTGYSGLSKMSMFNIHLMALKLQSQRMSETVSTKVDYTEGMLAY